MSVSTIHDGRPDSFVARWVGWSSFSNPTKTYLAIDSESEREISDGFVEKVDSWRDHVDWADVIVFDDVLGHGELASELRKKGKKPSFNHDPEELSTF